MGVPTNNNDPRKATALKSIATRETPVDFWATFDFSAAAWEDRAALAGAQIAPGSHVIDYGCANMKLEAALAPGCIYHPVDLIARDHRTTVADLNKTIPSLHGDVAVGLGLLEYILDVPRFLREVATRAKRGVFSYHPLDRNSSVPTLTD